MRQLRRDYEHIRFWFSGGKDSRLVLDHAIRHGIHLDQIVVLRHCVAGRRIPIGGQVETDGNAISYLEHIDYDMSQVRIIDLTADHYGSVFSDPDWIHHSNNYQFHAPLYLSCFFQYVNAKFGYFDSLPRSVNLIGCVQPHVYWENDQWHFCFVDYQHFNALHDTVENFMVSNECPEILHCYVRDLVQQLEQRKIRPNKFQTGLPGDTGNNQLRNVRDLIPQFRDIRLHRPDLEMPKMLQDPWRPTNDRFWRVNQIYKVVLSLWMCHNSVPKPQCFLDYVNNTDWDLVEASLAHGGAVTKSFPYGR